MLSDNDSTFASFLDDVLRRIDRGEPIDRERLLAEHEDLRPQLESFFRGQSLIGELLGGSTQAGRVGRARHGESAARRHDPRGPRGGNRPTGATWPVRRF